MTQFVLKTLLFVLWPPLAVLLLVFVVLFMVGAWFAIPFGKVVEKNGSFTLEFDK